MLEVITLGLNDPFSGRALEWRPLRRERKGRPQVLQFRISSKNDPPVLFFPSTVNVLPEKAKRGLWPLANGSLGLPFAGAMAAAMDAQDHFGNLGLHKRATCATGLHMPTEIL